jgi:hypothetical protein
MTVPATLEHPAFKWNQLKVGKTLQSQKVRASWARKTHTYAHDALARPRDEPLRRARQDRALFL